MKSINTLVDDVYEVLSSSKADSNVDVDKVIDDFGESMKSLLRDNVLKPREDKRTLRMSNIGRKERFLWYVHKGMAQEQMKPSTLMKFLYGHATEELVLALVKLAGHEVTHQQAEAEVSGIKGSMDCVIDGKLIDVKTAAPFGFKKFKEGGLRWDDPFGYVDQLRGYAASLGVQEGGWLVIDKTNGHLCTHFENFEHDEPIEIQIEHLNEVVERDERPEQCYELVPDGKSGNTKLAMECSYCVFKQHCFPNMKVFAYSTGPRFLVDVVNYPKVAEVYNYFDKE